MKPKTCTDCGRPWEEHTITRIEGFRLSLRWVCPPLTRQVVAK